MDWIETEYKPLYIFKVLLDDCFSKLSKAEFYLIDRGLRSR